MTEHLQAKVLVGVEDPIDISSDSISIAVNIRENKINDAVLTANDDAGITYLTNLQLGDFVNIEFAYVDDNTENFVNIFYGIVVGKEPTLDSDGGAICKVQLYAYPAIALNRMRAIGAHSLDPKNLDSLRDILCGKVHDEIADFPTLEFFTETGVCNNASTWDVPVVDSDWRKHSSVGAYAVMEKQSGGATNESSYHIYFKGVIGTGGAICDYTFGPYTARHGLPIFIDQFSNPQYDASNGTWSGIPYLTLYLKRDNDNCWLQIFLRRSADDYVNLEIDFGTAYDFFHLLKTDDEYHKLEIPVGRRWNEAPIIVDGETTIQSYMTDNATLIGEPINRYFGWKVDKSGESGSGVNADENGTRGGAWNDIYDINFQVSNIASGVTNYAVDLITISGLNNQFGIIPAFVNKYFNYDDTEYGINTDFVYSGQEVPFSKFVYQPITKCLQDIANLVAGKNWLDDQSAGFHWTVIDNYLCVAPVNDHTVHGRQIPITVNAYSAQESVIVSIDEANTFAVGQVVSLSDTDNSEVLTIETVTPLVNDTQIDFTTALVHDYTIANGAGLSMSIDQKWALTTKYTNSTPLVLGEDIIRNQFRHYEPEANFVLVNGLFERPPNNDWCNFDIYWWERYIYNHVLPDNTYDAGGSHLNDIIQCMIGTSYQAQWRVINTATHNGSLVNLVSESMIGPRALKFNLPSYANIQAALIFADPTGIFDEYDYPIEFDSSIDLNTMQSPKLTFWVHSAGMNTFEVRIYTGTLYDAVEDTSLFTQGDHFMRNVFLSGADSNGWQKVIFEIGEGAVGWSAHGRANWSKPIVAIVFYGQYGTYGGEYFIIDGLNISSETIRVAKSSAAIEAQGGIKTKLINELVIRGHTLGLNEYDALDQLAVTECLRCVGMLDNGTRVPITTGYVNIPFDPELLGGQQVWIQSPWFGVDPKCFRILYITHTYNISTGAQSMLYLTDDLSNSYSTDPTDLANAAIKAVNPDFQSRDFTRLKLGSIAWNSVIAKTIDVDDI